MQAKQKKPVSGSFRVRHDPPTLDEAIFAAQGLADDVQGQTEIAAMLMGLPEAEVKPSVVKAARTIRAPAPRLSAPLVSGRQVVVVERRAARTLNR